MSQIAPEIPELAHLPEVIRPVIWTRAMMRAVRSTRTHVMGFVCFVVVVAAGVVAGWQMLGRLGALAGGLIGSVGAIVLFFRVLIQRQARRLVPLVEKETDWPEEFRDALRAETRIRAVIAGDQEGRIRERSD